MNQICIQHLPQVIQGATKDEGIEALGQLKSFLSLPQYLSIAEGMAGEEQQFFFDKVAEIVNTIGAIPRLYGTEGKGKHAIAYLHYFLGGCDWFVCELDHSSEQIIGFGLAFVCEIELGYINIAELQSNNVELDLHWTPKALIDIDKEGSIH